MRTLTLFVIGLFASVTASATTYLIETTGRVLTTQNLKGSGLAAARVGDAVKVSFAVDTNRTLYPSTDGSTYLFYIDQQPDLQGGLRARVSIGGRPFDVDKYQQSLQLIGEMDNSNVLTAPTLPPTDVFEVIYEKMQDDVLLTSHALSTPIRTVYFGLQAAGTSNLVTGPVSNFARDVHPTTATTRPSLILDGRLELQSVVGDVHYWGFSADSAQVTYSVDAVTIRTCRRPFLWLTNATPWPEEMECEAR